DFGREVVALQRVGEARERHVLRCHMHNERQWAEAGAELEQRIELAVVVREVAEGFSPSTSGPYGGRATAQHRLGRNDDVVAVCGERDADLLAAFVRRGRQQSYAAWLDHARRMPALARSCEHYATTPQRSHRAYLRRTLSDRVRGAARDRDTRSRL